MKFKEFGLLNFGKFNNETINFYDGINIIYGENEFGKSTIVNFIDGVFYGFSRDSLKRKVRDDLFDKCRPWNSSSYNGYIEIIDKDETYRIFRDFETDEVSILNKSTGLNLSNLSVLNKYSRIEQPGAYFFDINRKVFKSTVFIGQNMSVFQDDAAEDLKKRVNNFATALDENINVNKVLDKMNKDIDSYGNERRKSSLIGSVTAELEKIERQKTSLILDKENYDINIKKLKDTKDELKALEKKYRGRKSYDIENLKIEIKELEKNLSEYAKKHDMDDFERAIEINNDIHSKSNRLDEILSLDQCEIIEEDKDISEDLENYKKAKAKIAELNINNYSKEMEFISVDIRNTRRKMNFYLIKIILGILIGFAVIGTAFYYNRPIFSLISAIFFTYSYFRIVKYNINKDLYNRLDVKLRDLKKLSIEKTGIKKEYDKYFDGLLKKYSVNSLNELDEVLKNFESENLKKKRQNEFNLMSKNKDEEEKKTLEKSILEDEEKLKRIFSKYNVESIASLREIFLNKDTDDFKLLISRKKDELNRLEDGFTAEEVYKEKTLEELDLEIRNKKLEISNLNGKISSLEASVERLKDLEERAMTLKKKKKKLIRDLQNITLARDKLLFTIDNNRDSYLPKLKSQMEKTLSAITNKKYEQIIIDKDFNIKVLDSSINNYVDVENLSLGTIDQIYFSFRIAMAKILYKEKLPLVLDGHFDSYDDYRLNETLKFLENYGQILIFTSSKREIELLNKNNMNYNLINLRWIWFTL